MINETDNDAVVDMGTSTYKRFHRVVWKEKKFEDGKNFTERKKGKITRK